MSAHDLLSSLVITSMSVITLVVASAGHAQVPAPEAPIVDRDGDGVADADDRCADDPEDVDGFEDGDGCPDSDNDRDGFLDSQDSCPDEAEDKDGFADSDGCIDPDDDGDGVPDTRDRCPRVPSRVVQGTGAADDGCPRDRDRDGIIDVIDGCPDQAEDRDDHEDEDGCPDFDNDGDGVLDAADRCADQSEDYDLNADEDGCPEPDDDSDRIPDSVDRCPDEKEDGVGDGYRSDGCAEPASYTYEPIYGGEHDLHFELAFASQSASAKGRVRAAGSGFGGRIAVVWNWFQYGVTFTFGDATFEGETTSLTIIDARMQARIVSWPQHARTNWSLVNLDVGFGFGFALLGADIENDSDYRDDEYDSTTGSVFQLPISNSTYLGPVVITLGVAIPIADIGVGSRMGFQFSAGFFF